MNCLSNHNILLYCVSLCLLSCTQVDQSNLQQKYLDKKIEDYKNYKKKNCMQEIMKKAEAKSDSFFVSMAKKQTFDSTRAPNPIQRPHKPDPQIREDSLPLGPLLKHQKKDSLE